MVNGGDGSGIESGSGARSNDHKLVKAEPNASAESSMFESELELISTTTLHTQRLQTLGMLAGGIAHDFNNILTGILGHVAYLQAILPPEGSHIESVTAIESGARKAAVITGQILNFSRLENSSAEGPVDLCQLASSTYVLLRGAIPPRFGMSLSIPPKPVYVLGVEARLAQILINLVINARDALTDSGSVEIFIQPPDLDLPADSSKVGMGQLIVRDNGRGMSAAVLEKAFERYYTTKGRSGTGLGLAVVREVLDGIGGSIEVKSEEGIGTEVTVYLPLFVQEDLETQVHEDLESRSSLGTKEGVESVSGSEHRSSERVGSAPPPIKEGLAGSERILLVDDEDPVRNVLALSLQHLGYSVCPVESGRSALERFEAEQGQFDLVILDMLMPHMSGDQLFFKLQKLKPAVAVLVMSGYSSEVAVRKILESGGRGFLQKPFTIEEFAKEIRRCLAI